MQPKFIQFPETKVVGLGAKFISIMSPDSNSMTVIPALWPPFIERMGTIPNRVGEVCYGLVEGAGTSRDDEMFYIACAPVRDFTAVPEGMVSRTIPAGRYASFTHKGKLDLLGQTMNGIYREWLPKSGCQLRSAPHLEYYDQRFIHDSDQSEIDILLPVK